jgi:hypothetical protein
MSDNSVKTSYLNGNLINAGTLSSLICEQSTNISIGLWNLCISSVCLNYKDQDQNGVFCSISCNLIKDKRYNTETKQTESYNPSIGTFFLKGRKIVYVEKTWFTINNQCSNIQLLFFNAFSNEKLKIDCDLHVTLLFKRIK